MADLRRDRGRERMAESQRSERPPALAPWPRPSVIPDSASPQAETADSSSACTVPVAPLSRQITTLFRTRARNWRHALQVI